MTDRTQSLLVIGAGWLGREVARRAASNGMRVVATTRSGEWRGDGEPLRGVELRPFDIVASGEETLHGLLRGVDAVVFCWAPSGEQDRQRLYVGGAERLARACIDARVGRVVYTSSTSALAAHDGWVDETFSERPTAPRGLVQREAEDALQNILDGTPVAWTILRLAGLYGPGRELARIYRVADTERVRPGDGMEHTNLVHLDDAAAAALAALQLPENERGLIQVCDDDHRTRREVSAAIAERLGHAAPKWEEDGTGRPPRGKRVSNTRMKERLGVHLRHPSHDA